MSKPITKETFSELMVRARQGEVQELHAYLKKLYEEGKRSLLQLAGSEADAEEYFSRAVAKFWEKFVVGNNELPESNIGGYIYTMAKFMCLDHKRKQSKLRVVSSIEQENLNRKELAESPGMASELLEASQLEDYRRRAIDRAIKQLSDNCQRLFTAMLETGLEKPRELFAALGLKNARAVTVLRYECTKQLKVKAAVELEILTSGLSETR